MTKHQATLRRAIWRSAFTVIALWTAICCAITG